jgi:uncharacterized protein VirK/YbjX
VSDFHNIYPSYFLISALQGFAIAINIHHVAGINASQSVAYLVEYRELLTKSYDSFFQSLGGIKNSNGFYCFNLLFREKPIAFIRRDHRSRTRHKRNFRSSISECVSDVMRENLKRDDQKKTKQRGTAA